MDISLAGNSNGAQATDDGSDQSSVTLKEGPTSLQFGGASVPVIADGTPPRTVLVVAEATQVEQDGLRILPVSPKLHISATDALSGVARTLISLDGAPFVPLPDGGPNVAAEGEHSLRYFSVDHVGNVEKVQEYKFRVDGTPPQTKLAISGPKSEAVVGVDAVLTLTANDAVAGVDTILYRLDGGAEQVYQNPLQLDVQGEGSHHIQYYSVDRVGNREAPQTYAYVVDRQPPAISLSIHGPQFSSQGVRYTSPKAEIELASRHAVVGATPIRYRIDGGAPIVYKEPFHLPESAGVHHLILESEDSVKNHVQVLVDDIFVDPLPPTTEVQFSRPFFVQNGDVVLNPASKIELRAGDLESGVESTTYSIDGGSDLKYSEPFSIAALGEHSLTVTAVDRVGNHEPVQHIKLLVQPPGVGQAVPHVLDFKRFYQHPKLGLLAPPGLPFIVRISTAEDPKAQTYMLSTGPTPPPAEQPLTFSEPGKNTISVGFSKHPQEFALNVDALPPKTQLTATGAHRADVKGVTYFGPGLNISLAAVDDPTGVVSGFWKTLYSLNDSDFTNYAAPLTAFTREGVYTLRYFSVDNVGNSEATHTLTFTVDTTPPVTQLELRGPHFASTVAPITHVALTSTDNLSGVAAIQYQIDEGKMLNYTEPFAIGPLSVGRHRLTYTAQDQAGNREQAHILPFTVAAPVSAATYEIRGKSVIKGGTAYLAQGSMVLLKAAPGESIIYSLDDGAPKTYTTPIPAPDSGTHRLSFHAQDDLELPGASKSLDLVMDRAAPNSGLRFEGPQLVQSGTTLISGVTRIVLDASAGPEGGATLEYSLGGNRWQPYTGPITINHSGSFDLSYRAHNSLTSAETTQRQHFVVDAQGPVISVSFSRPVDEGASVIQLVRGTLMFIDADDVPAGLEKITYKLDDQPVLIYRTPLSGFAPGKTHTITIVADDLLGNRSEKVVHVAVKEQAQ
jgi:hypothetical protein